MNHEELMKMSAEELTKHISDLAVQAKTAEGEALDAIMKEAEDAKAIIDDAKKRASLASMAASAKPVEEKETEKDSDVKAMAERGALAKQGAKAMYSAQLISKQIKNDLSVAQTAPVVHTAPDVKETFNDVSSLIDRVRAVPLMGGETYQRGYVKNYGNGGGTTAEGANYSANEPAFGYVTITKEKVTAYTEEPEEMTKLPNANYDGIVESSVARAVRRVITRQIINGNGSNGTIKGIFYNPASADDDVIDRSTDIALEEITADTLDEIIYDYGGSEDVEAIATLILNKADLKAFAKVKDKQGRKVYTIVNNGNSGTIDGVPFIINSACAALSATATAAGAYCMAYGVLENFELAIFSDIETLKSTESKFKEGQIAYRASTFVGGAVVAHNGFIRVKKSTE